MQATQALAGSTAHPDDAAPPVPARDRLRLILLLVLVLVWVLPSWGRAQVGDGFREQIGALRTGAAAALGLLILGGLAATSLLARTRTALRAGLAATHAVVAAVMTVLLLIEHPWVPGGALRSAWVPVFAPLALLAALDAWRSAIDPDHGDLLGWARALSGLFAAGAFYVASAPIPAGVAAWLGLGGFAALRAGSARGVRRVLETLVVLAGLVAGGAPQLQARFVGVDPLEAATHGWPGYVWVVLCAVVATTGVDGVLRPSPDPDLP
ncbi:MAG: hypothetical protein AB7T63_15050 [Planctomycetota bacterium]